MLKRILTLKDLISFCADNKLQSFNAAMQNNGHPIVVQVDDIAELIFDKNQDEAGMIYPTLQVCHTLLNANGSYISEDNMKNAMPTLKYRPILAKIHQLDDGSYDFHSHDMHIEVDDNNNEYIVYDEQQVGAFTSDEPYLEYNEDMDKTYVVATAAIPEEYTKTADIIRAKGGTTKVSCELSIYSMSFNAKEKYLELEDFRFNGCTLLGSHSDGTPVAEGMKGSKLTLNDFSADKNSVVEMGTINQKLDDILFAMQNRNQEGGQSKMNKFDELLQKYNKTEEDITFDHAEMTDEELEAKFVEMFGEAPQDKPVEKTVISYELSHDDIRCGLYNLLSEYEKSNDTYYYISDVYDNYFVYEDWCSTDIYGQKYKTEGDNVSFDGERYALHKVLLTDSEYAELNAMRSNYAELVAYKEQTEKSLAMAEKEAVLAQEQYQVISAKDEDGKYTNDAFAELVEKMDAYSVAELEKEAKVILADYYTQNSDMNFEQKNKETKKKQFVNPVSRKTNNRYGGLKFS